MLNRFLDKMHKKQKGITGLETAIILIAFVVVASVFAYTVLSAGLFATQKSSEAVYGGLQEAESTIKMNGSVLGFDAAGNDNLDCIRVTVSNALGGEPINFTQPTDISAQDGEADTGSSNVCVVSFIDANQRIDDIMFHVTQIGETDSDNLLEVGERFELLIPGSTVGTNSFEDVLSTNVGISSEFTIEIKPPTGATMVIQRTTPDNLDAVMNFN